MKGFTSEQAEMDVVCNKIALSYGNPFMSTEAALRSMEYGAWLRTNCLVSRNGWTSSSVPYLWEGEISNEKAYEMYLESLKDRV